MKFIFISILFLFGFQVQSKPNSDKTLECNERGCRCEGKGCSFVDKRLIKNASTISITCSKKTCGQKIVYKLKDKYGCKSSVQNIQNNDFMVATECLVMAVDGPEVCPAGTTSDVIEDLLRVCLEVPGAGKEHPVRK